MKKTLAVLILLGSIINAVLGVLAIIIEVDLLPLFGGVVGTAASFFVSLLLVASPLFAVLLLKNKMEGGVLLLLTSVVFLIFLAVVQTDDLSVEPAVNVGVWVLEIVMVLLTAAYWFVRKPRERG